ncbi:MAG: hypothetical protein IJP66_00055 [Kiritimatiellae bacterium]|nr:hypothetical protein [Kiritimatiellia bacterium]
MGRLEEIEARLSGRIAEIDSKIATRMADIDNRVGGGAANPGATPTAQQAPIAQQAPPPQAQTSAASIPGGTRAVLPDHLKGDFDSPALWETTPAELAQLMGYVTSSPHVVGNALYAQIAPRLSFKVDSDPTVNAYATISAQTPEIHMYAGAIRYANIVSAAYVSSALSDAAASALPGLISAFARFMADNRFQITPEAACAFAAAHGLNQIMGDPALSRRATSFAAGLIVGILAHEYGHLALGHLYGRSATLEISRNQEREADSFASSVISSSPFGDYMVMGSILWELAWVWQEKSNPGGAVATTHPLASERLENLLRANPSAAAQLGLKI